MTNGNRASREKITEQLEVVLASYFGQDNVRKLRTAQLLVTTIDLDTGLRRYFTVTVSEKQ